MWEMTGNKGKPQVTKVNASGYLYRERCFLCGQYLRKGDEIYIIIIPFHLRNKENNLKINKLVHKEAWDEFCKDISSEEDLAKKMISYKTPKKEPFTEDELKRIEVFKEASRLYGFNQMFNQPFGFKTKKKGTSITLTYNVYYHHIEADYNGRKGLFGDLWLNEISANVGNKMNELLGSKERNNFSSIAIINEVTQKAKEIL